MLSIRELAVVAVVVLLIYKYIIYPTFLSPLSRIPNAHISTPISPLWIILTRYFSTENRQIYVAHEKHGPVVRLGPNEISVNCVDDGLRTIYAGGFEKHVWYMNLFPNYEVPNMFSTLESRPHSIRKRMLSNVYSKSYLQSSPTMHAVSEAIIHDRLLPKLRRAVDKGEEVNVLRLFSTVTMDSVTGYIFGLASSTNFIEEDDFANWWIDSFQSRKKYIFWPGEQPGLMMALLMIRFPLFPPRIIDATKNMEKWCLKLCDAADKTANTMTAADEANHPGDVPIVYRQLKAALAAESLKSPETPMTPKQASDQRISIASELLDNLAAGMETSAITLTYLFHELCLNLDLQERLRAEVLTLTPSLRTISSSEPSSIPPPKTIDALPLLHATLMETLRLHQAIPGPQPRITPDKPQLKLGSYENLPPGVRVSSSAYCLHRNAAVFPEPESFKPERWLTTDTARKTEMQRWFWAFGSGGRMCIGSNLAMQEMKLIIAALLSNFRFTIVDDTGIEQEDAYTAQPTRQKLVLKLEAA